MSDNLSSLVRCGACLRKINERGGSILHMQGVGNRVICGEKAVQVWAVISVDDALVMQEKIERLEAEAAMKGNADED